MAVSAVGAVSSLSVFAYYHFEMDTPVERIPPVGLIFSAMTFAGFYAAEKEFNNEEALHESGNTDRGTLVGDQIMHTASVDAVPKIILRSSDYSVMQDIYPSPPDSRTVSSQDAISLLKDESTKRS